MELSELYLNRFLYKNPSQDSGTKGAVFNGSNVVPEDVPGIASGGAAQDINMGNVFINGAQLEPGTIPTTVLDVANWGWGQTCVFTSASAVQVNWGAGTFKSADGTSYAISAGNTGTMAAKTYIYLSLLDSETAYQITTVPADAVGLGKVLVAVAENGGTSATFNLNEATQIVGDNILANTINATKLNVSQLSAITADIGSITSGTITGALIRTSSSGSRVQLNDSTDALEVYDTGGDKRIVLDNDELTFYDTNGNERGGIIASATTTLYFHALNGGNIIIEAEGSLYGTLIYAAGVQVCSFTTAGLAMNDHITMNNFDINGIDVLEGNGNSLDFGTSTTRIITDEDIEPDVDNTHDLGGPSFIWNDIYVSDLNYNTLTLMSDIRLKENIAPLTHGLDAIMNLKPVFYNLKKKEIDTTSETYVKSREKNPEKFQRTYEKTESNLSKQAAMKHLGFIAQEVQEALPDIVDIREEDGMFSIRHTEIIPVLVRAIQELNMKINKLPK